MGIVSLVWKESRLRFIISVLLGIVGGLASAALLSIANSALEKPGIQGGGLLLGMYLGALLIQIVSTFMNRALATRLAECAASRVRKAIVTGLVNASLASCERMGKAQILSRLTSDITAVSSGGRGVSSIVASLAWMLSMALYMAWIWWWGFFGAMAVFVVGGIIYAAFQHVFISMLQREREAGAAMYEEVIALNDGIKELLLNATRRVSFVAESYGKAEDDQRDIRVRVDDGANGLSTLMNSTALISMMVMVFLLPLVSSADPTIVRSFVLAFGFAIGPLWSLVAALPTIGSAEVALRRIEAFREDIERADERRLAVEGSAPLPVFKSLRMEGVTYAHSGVSDDPAFVVGPIDFELRAGELVFLIGGNGSGKSTLAKILTGLYVPTAGSILWNGRPVDASCRDAYRQNFAAVFADFFLFKRLLGEAGRSPERARALLHQLGLDKKVKIEGNSISNLDLSQGQRKRLALLVALLEDRPAYVLDEWAADQDPSFRQWYYLELLPKLRAEGKAILAVTHDDRYYHVADRTIRLDDGKVIETAEGASWSHAHRGPLAVTVRGA